MYILFDIGATNIRFARSNDLKTFDKPIVRENTGNYIHDIVTIKEIVEELSQGQNQNIRGIAGGIAGNFDREKGILLSAPNLENWIGKPLQDDIRRMTGIKPIILNDADCGGLGEAVFGAGHGYRVVAYMTVSTGVGGALIIDGKPLDVRYGPEPGWQVINYDTKETIHQLASGKDLEELYGVHPKNLPEEVYAEVAERLSVAVYNAMLLWSPDIFVMGGSQMRDIKVEIINKNVQELSMRKVPMPEVVKAKLDSQNGLFGAMVLLGNRT